MPRSRTLQKLAASTALLRCLGALAAEPGSVAGTVELRRETPGSEPAAVVLYVIGFSEPPPAEMAVVRQRGQRFEPELIAITAGQMVSFPNEDLGFHNVFSLSATRAFDLGEDPRGDTKARLVPQHA